LQALQQHLTTLQTWLIANRAAFRWLRERYPAIDHIIKPTRVISAVPSSRHPKPNDRVAISADVEVQIVATITAGPSRSPSSRTEPWYQPPSMMPALAPTLYDVELPAVEFWKLLGTETLEVEAEATFTGDTYHGLCLSSRSSHKADGSTRRPCCRLTRLETSGTSSIGTVSRSRSSKKNGLTGMMHPIWPASLGEEAKVDPTRPAPLGLAVRSVG
jgi:hypothetical protein